MSFTETRKFPRQRHLWTIITVLLLPLLGILSVQYYSLRALEQALPVYRRENLLACLQAAIAEVENGISEQTRQRLTVSADAITNRAGGVIKDNPGKTGALGAVQGVAAHFKQQAFKGALRYFIAVTTDVGNGHHNEVLFFNPATQAMEFDQQAPELRAINVACAPYMVYVRARANLQPNSVGIDRDSEHPLIVRPVLDAEQRVIAVAGLTLDPVWFRNEALPRALDSTLPKFFPSEYQNAVVTLRYSSQDLIYISQAAGGFKPEGDFKSEGNPRPDTAAHFMPFFQRYALGLRMRQLSVEQWARRNFALTLTLALVMALWLTGGLLLTLRLAAHELKLSQMKTDFVANVSHELRTPLASIRVFSEMIKLGRVKDPNRLREYGAYLELLSRRLTQLIETILDFSSIESGQKQYQFSPTELPEVVAEALEVCATHLKQSGHTVLVAMPEQPLPLAVMDRDAMVTALANLLDNARKYSGESRQIKLQLSLHEQLIALAVSDDGIGIAPAECERIFEKFYRVSTGMVHDVKGTGLGLAIVKHIVEAHRGSVTVESELGHGSTFTIQLPLSVAETHASDTTLSDYSLETGLEIGQTNLFRKQ